MIRLKAICLIILIPIFGGYLAAQQPSPSLADVAKASRAKRGAAAKVVLNEETIEARKGPIPDVAIDGDDNSDEIVKKVLDYKAKRTPEEFEATIHEWYDQHQSVIVNALQDQKNVQSRMQDAMQSPDPKYYRTYNEAEADQVHAVRSVIEDRKLLHKEGFMIGRIRMAFQKVKRELSRSGLKYDWFKAEESFTYFYQ